MGIAIILLQEQVKYCEIFTEFTLLNSLVMYKMYMILILNAIIIINNVKK